VNELDRAAARVEADFRGDFVQSADRYHFCADIGRLVMWRLCANIDLGIVLGSFLRLEIPTWNSAES
jgi:hypothetical protein